MGKDVPGRWFVLHAKPRQEKVLSDALKAYGAWSYLPLVEQSQVSGRRKSRAKLPLFPGYVFLKGEKDDAYAADRNGRLVAIIEVVDQPRLATELASIAQLIDCGVSIALMRSVQPGTEVEVKSGPFKGVRGSVLSLTKPDRLWVQVSTLGQAVEVEMFDSEVDPL